MRGGGWGNNDHYTVDTSCHIHVYTCTYIARMSVTFAGGLWDGVEEGGGWPGVAGGGEGAAHPPRLQGHCQGWPAAAQSICSRKLQAHNIHGYTLLYTVEPPNKGHLGTRASVLYSEVSFIRRLEMYWHYRQVTFWCSESCPLFGGVLYSERPLSEVPLYTKGSTIHKQFPLRSSLYLPVMSYDSGEKFH